jgi:hypothetical protein
LHHLDESTDETLLSLFDKRSGHEARTASWNHVTMPSRNWAMITENPVATSNGSAPPPINGHSLDGAAASITNGHANGFNGTSNGHDPKNSPKISLEECTGKDGRSPLHPGEVDAGSQNRAVKSHGKAGDGSLDVCIRVEKDQHDPEGHTQPYGFWIPPLKYKGAGQMDMRKRDNIAGAVNART